uniref:Putative secreted protein n=1 Tax=Anopheles triannulatus TaxID=58253 RepID=A0A2M4B689_9DIPT
MRNTAITTYLFLVLSAWLVDETDGTDYFIIVVREIQRETLGGALFVVMAYQLVSEQNTGGTPDGTMFPPLQHLPRGGS